LGFQLGFEGPGFVGKLGKCTFWALADVPAEDVDLVGVGRGAFNATLFTGVVLLEPEAQGVAVVFPPDFRFFGTKPGT